MSEIAALSQGDSKGVSIKVAQIVNLKAGILPLSSYICIHHEKKSIIANSLHNKCYKT